MKRRKDIYPKIYSIPNLVLAYQSARKGKSQKDYLIEFERRLGKNLKEIHSELKTQTYSPKPLKNFILRDPKTRKISKSAFKDRVVHHALCRMIEPIFDKSFIYDSCANRKKKGSLLAIQRFDKFQRKISRNGKIKGWFNNNQIRGYCLKADIKHYFEQINHEILLKLIKKKIKDKEVIWLIKKILENNVSYNPKGVGMPLGNLTSQFFANIYLNELDRFVKHKLKAQYYIRYVDDFVILHNSRKQLENWKKQINEFIKRELRIELHPEKSRIISLSKGIDFVGFRNYYYFKLLRKRNLRSMERKVRKYKKSHISKEKIMECFQGWNAYAKWANSYKIRKKVLQKIHLKPN